MKKRIVGIDVARALAVFGMIIVNFKVVFGGQGREWVKIFAGLFEGKAAATFVVLAGVGIALVSNSALKSQNASSWQSVRFRILKRAFFLFVIGLSYMVIWPADILHFYAFYMLVSLFFLSSKNKTILWATGFLVLLFPALLFVFDYETGWSFQTLDYHGFWTLKGFFRNLFFNGFHPVIPWAAFMLFGLWLGRQNLYSQKFLRKTWLFSLAVLAFTQIFSFTLISILSDGDSTSTKELSELLGTHPMPPLPFYMVNGMATASFMIASCILICFRFPENKIIQALNKTGQLALTFYVAHVVLGMGIVEVINPNGMGQYSVEFSLTYAVVFSSACVLFAWFWKTRFKMGPLEWVMRKLTN